MTGAKLGVWSKKIQLEIDNQIEDIHKRDYKFYKVDRLERIAERIDNFSDNCQECEKFKSEVEDISSNLAYFLSGETNLRAEYEKRNEKIVKHLQKKHNLAYKDFYSSSYSFIGLSIGIAVFILIFWFINSNFLIPASLFGFTIGLFVGRFTGKKKDKYNEENNLIL